MSHINHLEFEKVLTEELPYPRLRINVAEVFKIRQKMSKCKLRITAGTPKYKY